MTTAAIAVAPARARGGSAFTSTIELTKRNVLKYFRSPQVAVVGLVQGAMFLLIFRYVFGGAIDIQGLSYVNFMVPGFIAGASMFAATGTAVAVAEDIQGGLFDRLRSLPIPRYAAPTSRVFSDTITLALNLAITVAIGFATGFRLHASLAEAALAFGICLLFGLALMWVFICIGVVAKTAQGAQAWGLIVFPFSFISSAYVPVASMPSWLQPFAKYQPLTIVVDAVRTLTQGAAAESLLGHTAEYYVLRSLIWCAALVVIFAPPAVRLYLKD